MNDESRVIGKRKDISYGSTLDFFNDRAERYTENNPYSVTMYQDSNPNLVETRNKKEVEKLLPLLKIDSKSRVLDVACGIGRWSDAIEEKIEEYCGIDFSSRLIELAKKRNQFGSNRDFIVGHSADLRKILKENGKGKYNRILLIGSLMYLNDSDVESVMRQVEEICEERALICIREPVGIINRLTLSDFYSEELNHNYNAIYRTRDELKKVFELTLMSRGFVLEESNFLFLEDKMNNREETSQYYFIFVRKG